MYPVHIMRAFVCDRLTAAAQEILGAFEKRVEDYEYEIARQRRLLDKIFSHETKLQQTDVPLSEEQSHLNQISNNESGSRFAPDITKIKDECEEMCISEEPFQSPRMTACDPNVSISHLQPWNPDQQSSANLDPSSHISNKDGEPESNREISAASAGCRILCEAEIQQPAAEKSDNVTVHVEASLNEKSAAKPVETSAENTLFTECPDELPAQINDDENEGSQVDAERFSGKICDDSKSTPASITEPSQLEESNEPTQIDCAASSTDNEQQTEVITHQSKATQSTPEGIQIQDEKSALLWAQKENVKEEPSESTKTPPRRLSGRKKASTSKAKHKSGDQIQTSSKCKELSSKNAASGSKEGTSIKRQNEGPNSDSAQKKRPKNESPASAKNNEEKKQALTKDPESSPSQCDDASGNSAAERENPFQCDSCGKVLSNFKNYKFHMKSHTVAKTYKCPTCGKMFRESWDLNKHLVIHSVEKPFKCDTCGNGFNRRYNLDLHVRVHTGEKPYQCNTCGKSFSSGVNMKKHTRIHTGEKPYTCKDCGKEFADSSAFKNHLRVHTGEKPFKCTSCKRKFATRTTLKRHTRTHTGEKPYKCTVCEKNFAHKTDLKGHMRMHTGEKPYRCVVCADQFSSWSKLNKHKRVHANEPQSSTNQSALEKKELN